MASRCVFAGGLTTECAKSPSLLESSFGQYGQVELVSIKKKNAMPFAFVTFASPELASRAVERLNGSTSEMEQYNHLFRVVELARLPERPRRKEEIGTEKAELARLVDLAQRCNLIIQIPTTHVVRLTTYVTSSDLSRGGTGFEVRILGSFDRKDESVMFIRCASQPLAEELLCVLANTAHIRRIIKKTYVMGDGKRIVHSSGVGIDSVASEALDLIKSARIKHDNDSISVRISSFPPGVTHSLISSMEVIDTDSLVEFSPTDASQTISVIELANGGAYILDISLNGAAEHVWGTAGTPKSDQICRAQHKIAEAFYRYRGGLLLRTNGLEGCVALDCGAAPGGWTAYLTDQVKCRRIYSVDPGKLAQEVLDRDAVCHMQMKIEKAIEALSLTIQVKDRIGIFVSDMVLHDMEGQVDRLLEARERGLLTNAYFILTLKNVRSKAKATIDRHAIDQAKRLEPIAVDIEILHLMSNKSSERTVVGRCT